jgi:hypothetical protein
MNVSLQMIHTFDSLWVRREPLRVFGIKWTHLVQLARSLLKSARLCIKSVRTDVNLQQ